MVQRAKQLPGTGDDWKVDTKNRTYRPGGYGYNLALACVRLSSRRPLTDQTTNDGTISIQSLDPKLKVRMTPLEPVESAIQMANAAGVGVALKLGLQVQRSRGTSPTRSTRLTTSIMSAVTAEGMRTHMGREARRRRPTHAWLQHMLDCEALASKGSRRRHQERPGRRGAR
ncbi:hypothetical protein GGTG_11686 [Gaeumannomyces tritici R3-111a-1]|uniref:Uncharacterized protein n=1 Tax=Gaeumannomyces tritici (strain R3-111a-1) TaxID=644352 RepID=J3PDW3_GAET3|nr:hypothetical protein GGTG_11686 [Gaeumannomyces tritici R3-111a-1]EJT70663.1 hypothetical protein GGTG_11686 [Gaeumannomyces tritici R3-111a-1]